MALNTWNCASTNIVFQARNCKAGEDVLTKWGSRSLNALYKVLTTVSCAWFTQPLPTRANCYRHPLSHDLAPRWSGLRSPSCPLTFGRLLVGPETSVQVLTGC